MSLFESAPTSGAVISACGQYRYRLFRRWDDTKYTACFIMLNPSTADAEKDDPTIRRCINFAKSWGNGGIIVVNLFAFRATKPSDMKAATDPVGPDNDRHILEAVRECSPVIAAWGKQGVHRNRNRQVSRMLVEDGVTVMSLKSTIDGEPWHPLYVPGDVVPGIFLDPSIVGVIK